MNPNFATVPPKRSPLRVAPRTATVLLREPRASGPVREDGAGGLSAFAVLTRDRFPGRYVEREQILIADYTKKNCNRPECLVNIF
jgi:hypothetical protein